MPRRKSSTPGAKKAATAGERESDLYAPVRDFLTAQGFTVRGEVRGCDVAGHKGEHVVVVEMKLGFTLDLLLQAVRRQAITDFVYVAVRRPARVAHDRRLRENLALLRRLELGLLLVDFRTGPPRVEVVAHPLPFQRRRKPAELRAILREIALRSGDDNPGGVRGRPLVTAYRENALLIAAALARFDALSPKQLRVLGTGERTRGIVYDNVYGWFDRVGPALYRLTAKGATALQTYADVVRRISEKLPVTTLAP